MSVAEKLTIEQKIAQALDQIRPFLKEDGGDIHFVELTKSMVVKVKFTGACTDCSMQNSTFKAGVEDSILRTIPEIKKVVAVS
jgi:Fe-S cluster biogenesis protein NfuA